MRDERNVVRSIFSQCNRRIKCFLSWREQIAAELCGRWLCSGRAMSQPLSQGAEQAVEEELAEQGDVDTPTRDQMKRALRQSTTEARENAEAQRKKRTLARAASDGDGSADPLTQRATRARDEGGDLRASAAEKRAVCRALDDERPAAVTTSDHETDSEDGNGSDGRANVRNANESGHNSDADSRCTQ